MLNINNETGKENINNKKNDNNADVTTNQDNTFKNGFNNNTSNSNNLRYSLNDKDSNINQDCNNEIGVEEHSDEHEVNNSIEVNDLEKNDNEAEMETDLNNMECLDVSSNKMGTSENVNLDNFKGTFQAQQNPNSIRGSYSNNFNNNKKTFLNISTKDMLEDNFSNRLKREVGYELGVDFFKRTDFKQILERKNDSNERSNSLGKFKGNDPKKYKKISNNTFLVDLNIEENIVNKNERPLSTISKKLNPKLQDNPKLKQLIEDFYTKEEHINYHNLNIYNLKNYLLSSNKNEDICKLLYDKELVRSKFNDLKYCKNIDNLELYRINKSKILGVDDNIGSKYTDLNKDKNLSNHINKHESLIVQNNSKTLKLKENGIKDLTSNVNNINIRSLSNRNNVNVKSYYGTIEKLKRTFSPMIENVNKRKNVNNMLENSLINLSDTVKLVKGINPRLENKAKIYDYDVILNKLNNTEYKINQNDLVNERRNHGRIKSSDLLITIDSKHAFNNDTILETNTNLGTAIKKKYDDFNNIVETIPDSLSGPKLFFIEKTNVDPLSSLTYREDKGNSYEDYMLKLQKELKSCVSLPEPHENAKVINSSLSLNSQNKSTLSSKTIKPNGNQDNKQVSTDSKLSNLDYLKFGILNKSLKDENKQSVSLSNLFKPLKSNAKKDDKNNIHLLFENSKNEFKTEYPKKSKNNDLKFWNNLDSDMVNFGEETLTEKYIKESNIQSNSIKYNLFATKLDTIDSINNGNFKENFHKKQMESMAKSLKIGFNSNEKLIINDKNDKSSRVMLEDTKGKFNFYIENNNVFDKIGVIKGNLSLNKKVILKNSYIK